MTGEKKAMNSITVEMGDEEYVMSGGGITPGVPIPADTVDSDAIIDGAVQMRDLGSDVKEEMMTQDDRVTREDLDTFQV